MAVTSFSFLVFFPVVVLAYYIIPKRLRRIWLLAVSYYFYMSWNLGFGLVLLIITVVTYSGALGIERIGRSLRDDKAKLRGKKGIVILMAVFTFSALFCFKYVIFVVGVSFYTLQSLGYIMDVYRGKAAAERNFLRYALFLSFFPTVVSGPIERSNTLLKQIQCEERTTFRSENVKQGLCMMMWGYFLKLVIAERIAIFVNAVYDQSLGGLHAVVATLLYGIQIYCDFAGYSTLAMGAGRVMGFALTENFEAPYLAGTVSEFWRRWHRSLTGWFRDYLYIPLGGNRKGKCRKYINIMIVFLVSGIWHGNGWKYLIWGGLNGFYQVAGEVLGPVRKKAADLLRIKKTGRAYRILQVVVTYLLVDFAWLFFRADSTGKALRMIKGAVTEFSLSALRDGTMFSYGIGQAEFIFLMLAILAVAVVDLLHYRKRYVLDIMQKWHWVVRTCLCACMLMAVIIFGVYGVNYDVGTFIYFAF